MPRGVEHFAVSNSCVEIDERRSDMCTQSEPKILAWKIRIVVKIGETLEDGTPRHGPPDRNLT
jgi:hypothetical protein